MSDAATTLIVETPKLGNQDEYTLRRYRLSRPVTLTEIWNWFSKPGRTKPICTLSGDTARVTF